MISVIVPVYNIENRLPEMLRCLQKQTYADFEVLLIDDGSMDGSSAICEQIALADSRFRVFHQPNSGVSAARNKGMQEMRGDYFAFVDGDDQIDDNYLEALHSTAIEHNAEMVVCDVSVECNGEVQKLFSCPEGKISGHDALVEILKRKTINSGPCAKMFRRISLPRDIKFPAQKTYEDILFLVDILKNLRGVASTNKTAYHYINNPTGAMSSFHKEPTCDIVRATDHLMQSAITEKLPDECIYVTLSHLLQNLQGLDRKSSSGAKELLKQSRRLYRKYIFEVWKCSAFPWKEKVLFSLFAFGIWRSV